MLIFLGDILAYKSICNSYDQPFLDHSTIKPLPQHTGWISLLYTNYLLKTLSYYKLLRIRVQIGFSQSLIKLIIIYEPLKSSVSYHNIQVAYHCIVIISLQKLCKILQRHVKDLMKKEEFR